MIKMLSGNIKNSIGAAYPLKLLKHKRCFKAWYKMLI